VRQLLPTPADVDPSAAHAALARSAVAGRPWVLLNVVTSVDGATAVGGVSGPLGSRADRAVFTALRAAADVVLAGAATVNAERYRTPRTAPADQERRRARGQRPKPRLAVVSGSLRLDPDLELFGDPDERPIVVTTDDAPVERRDQLAAVADVVTAGTGRVDLAAALAALGRHGDVVLCEGGSALNGQLIALDLVDEVNLTVSPALAAGTSPRLAADGHEVLHPLRLAHLWEADGMLLARYLVDRDDT
jgi:riboflavin biosynthesis pyrimidine reductase